MKKIKILAGLACALFVFSSCEEKADDVITPSVSFAQVNPILKTNCSPCHATGGGAAFESRAKFVDNFNIAKNVASGILNRVNRDEGAAGFMPRGGSKLSASNIKTVSDWIASGLTEN